ncbi:MAG: TIGR03546 family protein [Treponema sp.]|jgi:uncharacterized protein (TIGR03546 family)|nr:TIGR03546 family protein [Treponema sp.]
MIKPIAKLIAALNGNLKKGQIAAGFSWGFLLGLVPAGNVFWILLFAISFFFKHHHASKVLVLAVIKIMINTINPLLDTLGWEFLHIEALQPLFTTLYNTPFVPFTKFNNTLVTGGLLSGIGLFLPVFLLVFLLVPLYRSKAVPVLRNLKIVQVVKKLPLISALGKAVAAAAGGKGIDR